MKKILLSLVALMATMTGFAADKTVKFDFSKPDLYGYAVPDVSAGTPLNPGDKIEKDGVTITNTNDQESATAVRFFNSQGTITFRLASGGNVTITAAGKIKALHWVGYYNEYGKNFTSNVTTGWIDQTKNDDGTFTTNWEGEATSINIVRVDKTVQFSTLEVTYESNDEPGTDPEPTPGEFGEAEKYTAISYDNETKVYTVAPEFAAVVADATTGGVATNATDGASIVNFGTENLEAQAVGGTVASGEDGAVTAEGVQIWGDIKWDWKNQGDINYGYIVGTGNPVFGYEIEEITTDDQPTGKYRQNFTGYYYTPDCGSMPAQGLYYKFTAKKAGQLKIYVWSNKGNRNTYLVDEATTKPVTYAAEGYINGQNNEDGTKKWLTTEEIQALGSAEKPYVIGAGNQNYWGAITYVMAADQTVWLFQDSSQIGFQGFEFAPVADTTDGIEAVANVVNDNRMFTISGQQISAPVQGQVYIMNGKKYIAK